MKLYLILKAFFSRRLTPARIFAISFVLLILLGTLALWFPFAASRQSLSFTDALFASTSAVCVTGLATIDIGKDLSFIGQLITLFLFQVGGLGIITFSIVLFALMGRGISFKGREIAQSAFMHTPSRDFYLIIKSVLRYTLIIEGIGTALLFITHDLGLAAERAQHIVVMYKGQVVESGPSLEVLQHPQHPYTKRLVAAAPSLASQRIISVKEHGGDATAVMEHAVNEDSLKKGEAIITVDHLTKEFKLPRKKEMFKAVDDVSFSIKKGTTLAIVGESGSGKSTVANMVLKLLEPTAGTVTYDGKDISGFKGKELLDFRRHVQPVFQNPYGSLDPMYSIYRSIEEPLRIHGIGDKKSRAKRVRELIDMVELPESVMSRYPNELSGGQRQRIAIARAMALDPDVIVCDEAVSALDVLVQDQVLRLLNDLQAEKGLSYLFITHDLAVVRQIADEVVVMQHGKLVEHATTDEVFDHPKKQYTRDLLDAIPGGKLQLGLD